MRRSGTRRCKAQGSAAETAPRVTAERDKPWCHAAAEQNWAQPFLPEGHEATQSFQPNEAAPFPAESPWGTSSRQLLGQRMLPLPHKRSRCLLPGQSQRAQAESPRLQSLFSAWPAWGGVTRVMRSLLPLRWGFWGWRGRFAQRGGQETCLPPLGANLEIASE